jgi:uncharacterized membrane protein YgcG
VVAVVVDTTVMGHAVEAGMLGTVPVVQATGMVARAADTTIGGITEAAEAVEEDMNVEEDMIVATMVREEEGRRRVGMTRRVVGTMIGAAGLVVAVAMVVLGPGIAGARWCCSSCLCSMRCALMCLFSSMCLLPYMYVSLSALSLAMSCSRERGYGGGPGGGYGGGRYEGGGGRY